MYTRAGGYFHHKPTMKTTRIPTVHRRKTSVTDLLPDLLSSIFKFIHESSIQIRVQNDIMTTWMCMTGPKVFEQSILALLHPMIPGDQSLKTPTLFLYSLAAVRFFWRDVLCPHPTFWTLVVLFIDSKSTSLVDASLFLEGSRKHRINVFIICQDALCPAFYLDRHEKCQFNSPHH